jgi:hydroxyacylglutathione hydrolase
VFVGDVGRPDLLESAMGLNGIMEASARRLRESLHDRLAPLADYLQLLPAHGAGSACGKAIGAVPTSTLGYERRFNGALKLAMADAEGFVKDILSGQPEPPPYFATMKRVNRDGIAVTDSVPKPPHLSPKEFSRAAAFRVFLHRRGLVSGGERLDFAGCGGCSRRRSCCASTLSHRL